MTNDARPPREWFLVFGAAHHCRLNPSDIHVIEKSAHDALAQRLEAREKELAEVRAKLEARDADETAAYMIGYSKSQDEARAEIEQWKAKYIEARSSGFLEGREESRDEIERLTRQYGNIAASQLIAEASMKIQSRDALIERCEKAFQYIRAEARPPLTVMIEELLAEIASFKKGKLL